MKLRKLVQKITSWIKENPVEFWILLAILIIGAFCRLYKIDQYMTFLGDEGRDVIIVRRIFTELHPPLIGPGASVGGMYLGPLYYYMMAIPLLIAGFSPVGPAVMVALLGVITIAFIWWVGRTWFGKWSGIIAGGFYAISPTAIIFSHSSWNPNIMPFFAILSIFSIWKIWKQKKLNWLIVLGISSAFVLQSHYLGLLLLPTVLIFWFLTFRELKNNSESKPFINKTFIGIVCFLILMSPLLIFEFRHNFMNTNAIYKFIAERRINFSSSPTVALEHIPKVFNQINKSLIAGKNAIATALSSIIILAGIVFLLIENYIKQKNFKIKGEYWLLLSWLGIGLVGFAVYRQNIYDHYFGFLFPVPSLLLGIIISKLLSGKLLVKFIGIAILIYFIVINLLGNPLLKEPNRLMKRSMDVSRLILNNVDGKPFNLAVIADTNYEDGYKYFLLKDRYPVLEIDAQKPESVASQLFVVCELIPNSKCDPTHSPKAQVASFGWSKIEGSWEVDGAIVYKLVHVR